MIFSSRKLSRALLLAASVICLTGARAYAQMSPGDLSSAHRDLDGPLKCASCHAFGAGAVQYKCLDCHDEIRRRINEKRGYHLKVVRGAGAQAERDCARCHAEHVGRQHQLIRWRTPKEKFDHREAGYALEGKHAGLACEKCHAPKNISAEDRETFTRFRRSDLTKVFAGLTQRCTGCHRDEHHGDLGADCQRCHTLEAWKPATGFSHEKSQYPLEGAHQRVACDKCHKRLAAVGAHVQYKNFVFFETCKSCHRDPHGGTFQGDCQKCHSINAWKPARPDENFSHDRTDYPLKGKHATVECRKCHKSENFKVRIAHEGCMDCHQDKHGGQFSARAGGECGACHTESGWKGARFGVKEHASTRYPLSGLHAKVECVKCHPGQGTAVNYHPASSSCRDCHKDRHAAQFAAMPHENRCEHCHTEASWRAARYRPADHLKSRFPLNGAHAAVACASCHRPAGRPEDVKFHFASALCKDCHEDTHRPREATAAAVASRWSCESCHTAKSWRETGPFDHGQTDFALLGRHRGARCTGCHKPALLGSKTLVSFKGTARECAACHADIHDGQFQGGEARQPDCGRCHTATNWHPTEFDHRKHSNFSLAGAHAKVPCQMCHLKRKDAAGRTVVIYRGTPRTCQECHR